VSFQDARASKLYPVIGQHLQQCTPWEDDNLDPALFPLAPPKNNTVDGHIARDWFTTGHISHVYFLEALQPQAGADDGRGSRERTPALHRSSHASLEEDRALSSPGTGIVSEGQQQRSLERTAQGMHCRECDPEHVRSLSALLRAGRGVSGVSFASSHRPARVSSRAVARATNARESSFDAEVVQPAAQWVLSHVPGSVRRESNAPLEHARAPVLPEGQASLLPVLHSFQRPGELESLGAKATGGPSETEYSGSFSGKTQYVYTVLVNQTAKHALPVAINEMSNALLRALRSREGDPPVGHIKTSVEPFPVLPDEQRVRLATRPHVCCILHHPLCAA
jgi:hypothetical protein